MLVPQCDMFILPQFFMSVQVLTLPTNNPPAPIFPMTSFDCPICGHRCLSCSGLSHHKNYVHLTNLRPDNSTHKCIYHWYLDGKLDHYELLEIYLTPIWISLPCNEDGTFLEDPHPQIPLAKPVDDLLWNSWASFEDCLEFDWAYYHYVHIQSLKSDILEGLDLWHAAIIKHSSGHLTADGVPWHNADDLYATINSIQSGDAPWKSFKFSYAGPKPPNPPTWMEEMYKLNTWDVLLILKQQLATSDFDGQIDYIPYEEFDAKGDRVYSNLMSGYWASCEAVGFPSFKCVHMLKSILEVFRMLLCKTSQLMAQCLYQLWPEVIKLQYPSPLVTRNITLSTFPLDLFPILLAVDMEMVFFMLLSCRYLKVFISYITFSYLWSFVCVLASKRQWKHPEFQRFCCQLYHWCLELVFELLKAYMEKYKVVKCPEGHLHHAIFGPGPYITNYPEQVWLAGVIYGWCPK